MADPNKRFYRSSHLIWSHFIGTECAVIGRNHGELSRFTARDPVRRGCVQSQRTQGRMKWDEWYERSSINQAWCIVAKTADWISIRLGWWVGRSRDGCISWGGNRRRGRGRFGGKCGAYRSQQHCVHTVQCTNRSEDQLLVGRMARNWAIGLSGDRSETVVVK